MRNPGKRGRPAGRELDKIRSIRFEQQDYRIMRALAKKWRCSEAAAVRRALAIAAKEEKLTKEELENEEGSKGGRRGPLIESVRRGAVVR